MFDSYVVIRQASSITNEVHLTIYIALTLGWNELPAKTFRTLNALKFYSEFAFSSCLHLVVVLTHN